MKSSSHCYRHIHVNEHHENVQEECRSINLTEFVCFLSKLPFFKKELSSFLSLFCFLKFFIYIFDGYHRHTVYLNKCCIFRMKLRKEISEKIKVIFFCFGTMCRCSPLNILLWFSKNSGLSYSFFLSLFSFKR